MFEADLHLVVYIFLLLLANDKLVVVPVKGLPPVAQSIALLLAASFRRARSKSFHKISGQLE